MTALRLNLLLLWLGVPTLAHAQFFAEPGTVQDSITITYRDLTLKKKNKRLRGRVQFRPGDTTWLVAHYFDRLPPFFRRFTVSSASTRQRFNRRDLLPAVKPTLDAYVESLQNDTLFFTDALSKKWLFRDYAKHRDAFYTGKRSNPFFSHNWVPLFPLQHLTAPGTLTVRGTFFRKVRYKTDRLPAAFVPQLPALDHEPCQPYNRFHELRKMQGYGLEKFRYIRYRAPDREAVRQSVEIYFEKNSVTPAAESVQRVMDFLRNNQFSILQATIVGYSSLEGSEQANERLQQKRARILIEALQRYNNEPIVSDTVMVQHGYELFRQAIRPTEFSWLDTLDNEALRNAITLNADLQQAVEPYLVQHRKATLHLVLAKKLEGEEIFERFTRDFYYWEKQLHPHHNRGVSPMEIEARLMGMIEYLFDMVEANLISAEAAAEVIDLAYNNHLVRILTVYHHIIQHEKQSHHDSLSWEAFARKNHYNELFSIAQTNLINLIAHPGVFHKHYEKFRKQLVDIQTYSFDYVQKGWLSLEALCALDYPDSPRFRGYKLNQLAFLQYMTQFGEVPCEELVVTGAKKQKVYTDDWLDELRHELHLEDALAIKLPNGKYLPTFGEPVYSPLLFYLKKLFLSQEKSIRQHVITSDNFYEFDLLTLVMFNVENWDPWRNYFQDEEIQLKEMDKLVGLLKKINKRICKQQVDQLYLDYHLKALHYLSMYYEPGNDQHTAIAQQSMRFIAQYYQRHASRITPRLSLYLMNQFNALHTMPGRYDGTWFAWNILKRIADKRALTTPESHLFKKYNHYFSPVKN